MNQYRHARISQYIPKGYNQAVLDNAAQFADRLGDALEQNGRNATLFVNVAKSGNAYLQTGDKQMIFLNQDSLKGNPNEVSGYIGKDNPDNDLRNIVKSVSAGKQQGNQQNGFNINNQYTGRPAQNGYNNNGYNQNGYNAGNGGYSGYPNGNAQQRNGFAPSLVGIGAGINRQASYVKAAEELGNKIGSRLGLQPQQYPSIWVNQNQYGVSLSLKIGNGTAYLNLNQLALLNGRGEISGINDTQHILDENIKQSLMSEFAVQHKNIFLNGDAQKAMFQDKALNEALQSVYPVIERVADIVDRVPEKPSYTGKDQRQHISGVTFNAAHREKSPVIDITLSIRNHDNHLNVGFSATSVAERKPAVKYVQIYPKGQKDPVLQNLISAIEQNPEIAKLENYRYHENQPVPEMRSAQEKNESYSQKMQGNPEKITASPQKMHTDTAKVRISDMVNVYDSFVRQGLEKMKVLAQSIQSTLENGGVQTSPVIFVGKHGNPPAYVANIEIADGNCQMKLYVNDSSLKTEKNPYLYDFSTYDRARGMQGREEQLTEKLKTAVNIIENRGYFRETELQRFAKEYNSNPNHKATTAVYHRAGDVYSDFGKTAHVNTEMVEILATNGDNKAVPRAFLDAKTGEIDVLVKTPNANIMSSQLSPELTEKLAKHYLSAESMRAVCQIAKIPEPQNKAQDIIQKAENSGIHTTAESKGTVLPKRFFDDYTENFFDNSERTENYNDEPEYYPPDEQDYYMNPEEDLYTQMEHLEFQGFQGTLQDLKQAVGYQGSLDALKDYVENCGFEKLIIQQKTYQDKLAE